MRGMFADGREKGLLGGWGLIAMEARLRVGGVIPGGGAGKEMGVRLGGDGKQARWGRIADCLCRCRFRLFAALLKLVKEKVRCVAGLSQTFFVCRIV